MALKGNLRDFSTTQLLNLINLARKTGTLTIDGQEKAKMAFRNGKLIYASTNGAGASALPLVLQKTGKLSPEQAKFIQQRAKGTSEKQLGHLLIQAGYVTQVDIIQSVRQHILDTIYKLFTWADGLFRFDTNTLPPAGHITIPIDLESVIMEGSRRLHEWENLQEELPNLNAAMKFVDKPDARLRHVNLTVQEWRVVSFINPKNSMKQIATANNLGDFEIRRIVYGLLQAGIIEFVNAPRVRKMPAIPTPPSPATQPQQNSNINSQSSNGSEPEQKRSLINRIIKRVRRI